MKKKKRGLRKKISELRKKISDEVVKSLRGETDEYKQTVGKLTSYLDSLGVHVGEIDPAGIMLRRKGDGGVITVFLKNSNIDGLLYWTWFDGGIGDVSGNKALHQGPHFMYALKCETGNKREELRANTKKIKNGIFGRPVDFKWVGGQIADILNQDTELKEPLYDELNITHPKEFDESSWTGRYCKIGRKGDIKISSSRDDVQIETPETENYEYTEDLILGDLESTFPPPHVFKAYDKIAKHIREYVQG